MLRMAMVSNVLNPEDDMILDLIRNMDQEHQSKMTESQAAKEIAEKAKVTCICVWETPEMFSVDPDCPIHGAAQAEALREEISKSDDDLPIGPPGSVQREGTE
jgi:hypothetical protein